MMTVCLDDGSEEFLTTDFEAAFHEAIMNNTVAYVANIDDQANLISEYKAEIIKV